MACDVMDEMDDMESMWKTVSWYIAGWKQDLFRLIAKDYEGE